MFSLTVVAFVMELRREDLPHRKDRAAELKVDLDGVEPGVSEGKVC